jgi:hypothetical protein
MQMSILVVTLLVGLLSMAAQPATTVIRNSNECTRQQHNNNTGGNKIQMLGRAMKMMIIQPNDRTQAQNSVNVNETTVD